MPPDVIEFWDRVNAAKPSNLVDLELPALLELQKYFSDVSHGLMRSEQKEACSRALDFLRPEIELKRIEKQSEGQHQESMVQGSTILYWTKWAVGVGVVVPILVALIAEIPFSKLLPAKSSQASPQSSPIATATDAPSAMPTATESPSVSPQESPTSRNAEEKPTKR